MEPSRKEGDLNTLSVAEADRHIQQDGVISVSKTGSSNPYDDNYKQSSTNQDLQSKMITFRKQ